MLTGAYSFPVFVDGTVDTVDGLLSRQSCARTLIINTSMY